MIEILTSVCNKIWKTGEWPTLNPQLSHSQRKATCSCARTTEPSALLTIIVRSCWRSSLTDSSHKQQRSLQKSKQVSEPEGAPQNKYSVSGSSARNTCSISRISTACLHRLQEGLWQGMARNFMGNYEEMQHQRQHRTSHWKSVWEDTQSAVLFNGSTGEWFRTTVGVRQGCLLSPTLFNIWHCRKCSRGRRSWRPGRPSRYNHHKVQNGDRSR